jgi:hypothetical protein
VWRKSSHSGAGNCVEVEFRKSRHSAGNGACVEVAFHKSSHSAGGACVEVGGGCGMVYVRDSKDKDGGILSFEPAVWSDFLRGMKIEKPV